MKLTTEFDEFHEKIVLGDGQHDRIGSAATRLEKYLREQYVLEEGEVFLQGSYVNDTAVRPDPERDGGEYDVDLVAICADADASPDDALGELEEVLSRDKDYEQRIDRENQKKPCIRLRYAADANGAGFHVDATPARASDSAPLEIPRRDAGWHDTAPAEFTQWCQNQGDEFGRLVRMLKRWRDHHQDAREAVKSIVLQVLVAGNVAGYNTDAERVAGVLRAAADELALSPDSAPEICNPVLPDENLAERWEDDDYVKFRRTLGQAADLAEEALDDGDLNESRRLWQKLFGKDFPGPSTEGRYSSRPVPPSVGRRQPQEVRRDTEWGG